jgi:hypothetical protein
MTADNTMTLEEKRLNALAIKLLDMLNAKIDECERLSNQLAEARYALDGIPEDEYTPTGADYNQNRGN